MEGDILRAAVVLVALTIAGVGMTVVSKKVRSAFEQAVLMHIGSAIFAAGLTFFLLKTA